MARLVVRDLDDDVKERLQCRAKRHGRSTEEEVREILREAVRDVPPETNDTRGLGTRISERFRGLGLTKDLEELPYEPPRPATFDE